jgi:hypothetical protein
VRGPARKDKLIPSLHYTLTLLTQGPRFYSTSMHRLVQLEKRGYAVLTGATADDGSREWEITEAGRIALRACAENDAL